MIIETLRNDDLETKEKLMILIYHLGMVDRFRLAKLLDVSVHTIDQSIKRLNKKNKEEKHIISYSAPFNKGPKLYQLGPAGWRWMMGWIDEDRKYYQRSEGQKRHYNGMTDILIRLLESMDRKQAFRKVTYANTHEATERFRYPWEMVNWERWQDQKLKYEESKMLPRPDLYISVGNKGCWGEYDTGSEGELRIKSKNRRYFQAFNQLKESSRSRKPIVWIVPTESRKWELQNWFEEVKDELAFQNMKNPPPEMYFFVEGEDTEFFLQHTSQIEEIREEKKEKKVV